MKYSLRSLMIVVTLVCVAFGCVAERVRYLSRKATFHDRQYARSLARLASITNNSADLVRDVMDVFAQSDLAMEPEGRIVCVQMFFFDPNPRPRPRNFHTKEYAKNRDGFASEWRAAYDHRRLAEAYRHAIRRPFELVDESSPPPPKATP